MPLIRGGAVVDDPWVSIDDDGDLPATAPVIVSLERWHAEGETLRAGGRPVGVRLKRHQLAGEIADAVGELALVALEFPSFRDGRAYSTARRLREHLGFRGELRACGNILRDQLLFMQRCGFDTFEVTDTRTLAGWQQAFAEFSVFYQATGDGRPTAVQLRQMKRAAE